MDEHDLSDLEAGPTAIHPERRHPGEITGFALEVKEGPDAGAKFELDFNAPSPILLGSGPACAVRLSDPHVSRRHAAIELRPNRVLLTDLDSTNGTFVDGVSVVGAHLRGDEIVRIGSTALQLIRTDRVVAPVIDQSKRFGQVVGSSTELLRLYPLFHRLAACNIPAVIEGETGTGKEVLAESIHAAGARASGPFVVFDCTAVPPNLVESELFGHERGAFTGAVSQRIGLFEQAASGTLLIDEIGDLEISLQPRLLRAIERSEIRRVGGSAPIRIDVRLLAATRRDLDKAVQEGRFRDDLYHRLAVARVELPPLRRRTGDIAVLVRHFWRELAGQPREVPDLLMKRWESSAWPGNVRELKNAVARWIALGEAGDIPIRSERSESPFEKADPSGDVIADVIQQKLPLPLARLRVVEAFESRYIAAVLAEYGGNVPKAAEASGIARRYFQILRTGRRRGSL